MDDNTFALHLPFHNEHIRLQDFFAILFENLGEDNNINRARGVLQGNKHDAFGGPWLLAYQDQPGYFNRIFIPQLIQFFMGADSFHATSEQGQAYDLSDLQNTLLPNPKTKRSNKPRMGRTQQDISRSEVPSFFIEVTTESVTIDISKLSENIAALVRDQIRINRQMADLKKKQERINSELEQLIRLKKGCIQHKQNTCPQD